MDATDPDLGRLRRYQARLAPGTALRAGLERIVHGRTGALLVLGAPRSLLPLCQGGFQLDVPFSETAVRELAKMDGAIVLTADLERIVMAGVHLVPDPTIPSLETGTRHRTADIVARQTGLAVVTVSASMSTIALYLDGHRWPVARAEPLMSRASQAVETLERYARRLTQATQRLSVAEVQDQVSVREVVTVLQRLEMVRRIQVEIEGYVVELGADGRHIGLQLGEAVDGLDDLAHLLFADYDLSYPDGAPLAALSVEELPDPQSALRASGIPGGLDDRLTPHGHRLLAGIHRLPPTIATRLTEHFGSVQALCGATAAELMAVEGVGEQRARVVRDALARLADAAYDDA